ncbi:glutamine amidotransferase [Lacisediminihabitans sp.]|jgi:CobQ-like glutamine amidotransferase family enzyme|uniref:type 1 glutamine amidotransferase n=1 Tax=Lacisediminihabitans sp. TaxID=2787631 RepID=UPI002F952D1B
MNTTVTIVQLYPDELGVAGDRGNVMALRARLEHAGLAVSVVEHHIGNELPADADLVVVGNGPLSAMRNVYDDLVSLGDRLRAYRAAGVPVFAYGSGAELLGRSITLLDGSTLDGLGILPFRATRIPERSVGYVIVDTPFGQVVGFEDNASRWSLDAKAKPLGILEAGTGNSEGAVEGVLDGTSIGTQVGGPVLPLNPLLTDAIIGSIASRRGIDYTPADTNADLDRFAARAREVIAANAKHVFSRI